MKAIITNVNQLDHGAIAMTQCTSIAMNVTVIVKLIEAMNLKGIDMKMPKVHIIDGTDPNAQSVINWLVEIYNRDGGGFAKESFEMKCPNTVAIIYAEGAGGIIVDLLNHRLKPDSKKLICQFLCIEKQYRGNGLSRLFVDCAISLGDQNDVEFVGAYVNGSGEMDFWSHIGYPHQGNVGFTLMMTKRKPDELF